MRSQVTVHEISGLGVVHETSGWRKEATLNPCRKLLFIVLLMLFSWTTWSLTGCSYFQSQRVESAEELASKGMEYFDDEDYDDALKTFTILKEHYPYSRYAILAELKVADAHFHRQEYPEAIAAYEYFARLHPKNEAVPYVFFQIGTSHYEQLCSSDRDQTETHKAILAFDRLLKAHPGSAYTEKAKERITTCRELLAEHELYVGRFYYKSKHYKAALGRFQGVLDHFHDTLTTEKLQQVEKMIFACEERIIE
jgi:outer membrane protein assembly factor BamD